MRKRNHTFLYIVSFFVMLMALSAAGQHRATAYAEGTDRIYYFNMDSNGLEGNMILVETDGHWGLMDAGHRFAKTITDSNGATYSTAVNGLSSQIKCRNGKDVANYMINVLGVKHLDFIIGTHAHSDHIGGIPEIAATTYIDEQGNTCYLIDSNTTYYYKEYEHISDLEDDLEKYSSNSWHNQAFAYQAVTAMEERGATLINVADGRVVTEAEEANYGDFIEFKVGNMTFRLYNLDEQTFSGNENINSIVTVIANDNYTVVNLADININNGAIDKVSEAIAKDFGTVDIVVAGHHGYTGSNTKEMFDELQPEFVVISNGYFEKSWLYTSGDLAAAMPYASGQYGTTFYGTSISYYATITDLSGNSVYVYSIDGKGNLADAMNKMIKSTKKTGWVSWVNTDETLWSYLVKGKSVRNAWKQVGKKWYHFDDTGIMQTGWISVGRSQYFLDPDSGAAVGGWVEQDGQWYYMSKSEKSYGKMLTGWHTIKNKKYYFNDDGTMVAEGWVDGHYLKASGAMATGWLEMEDGWHYFNTNTKSKNYGKQVTGWHTISKKKYFFDENGRMLTETWVDDCYLKASGAMATGWLTIDDEQYYLNSKGRKVFGWQTISKKRYFFDENGHMVTETWIDDCYLQANGVMATGWQTIGDKQYYLNSKGRKVFGWKKLKDKWYFFDDNGCMVSDEWVDGCYLKSNGVMATGWLTLESGTYYLDKNEKSKSYGLIKTGWQKISKKWYFFRDDGRMVTEEWIDGYYLKSDGVMATGWLELETGTYYLNPNTKSKTYGQYMTGWQKISKTWYFFGDDGRMFVNEWVDDFYLTGDGSMATGWYTIDGKQCFFDDDGHYVPGAEPADETADVSGQNAQAEVTPNQEQGADQNTEQGQTPDPNTDLNQNPEPEAEPDPDQNSDSGDHSDSDQTLPSESDAATEPDQNHDPDPTADLNTDLEPASIRNTEPAQASDAEDPAEEEQPEI